MKRMLLIKHLTANNCVLLREGKKHSLYKNMSNGKFTAVPRHPDIQEITVKKICNQLDIPIAKIN